jgi:hypothetical protein
MSWPTYPYLTVSVNKKAASEPCVGERRPARGARPRSWPLFPLVRSVLRGLPPLVLGPGTRLDGVIAQWITTSGPQILVPENGSPAYLPGGFPHGTRKHPKISVAPRERERMAAVQGVSQT